MLTSSGSSTQQAYSLLPRREPPTRPADMLYAALPCAIRMRGCPQKRTWGGLLTCSPTPPTNLCFMRRARPEVSLLRLVTLFLALSLGAAGCSAGSTAYQVPPEVDQSSIVVATTSAPASLDFTNTSGAAIP